VALLCLLASGSPLLAQLPPAPTFFTTALVSPSRVNLSWRDNAINETNYAVAVRVGTSGDFVLFPGGSLPANSTNFSAGGLFYNTTYQFFVQVANPSGVANSVINTVVTPAFPAPANVSVTALDGTRVQLSWQDVNSVETDYLVAFRQGSSGNFALFPGGLLAANSTNFIATGLTPSASYEFIVAAYFDDDNIAESPIFPVDTKNVFLSRPFSSAVVGVPFFHQIQVSTGFGEPLEITLSGTLPDGIDFDNAARTLSGTPTQAGVFPVTLQASYPSGDVATQVFTFRIIHPPGPPVVTAPIPTQNLTKGGPAVNVPLPNFFTDLDTEKAVRFQTTLGAFNLALYATATPLSVSNFLNYVNRGDYSNTVVHRSQPGFVVQGGSFRVSGTNMVSYPLDPPVKNEPGVEHLRGTVSYAKAAGVVDSGAAGLFFNLNDNSPILDPQSGGFAAFGRVTGNGMSVVDAIAALPIGNYNILLDGVARFFDQLPVNAPIAPSIYNPANNVIIQSVSNIPPLQWSVGNPSVTGIVSAAIVGTNLQLTPLTLFGGVTELPVIATDLDGNSVTQLVNVQITSSYTTWLNGFGLAGTNSVPGADTYLDRRENGVEFAFGGNPTTNDAALLRGTNVLVTTNSQQFLAMRFRLRKDLSGATALLQGTPALGTPWTNVWTSADLNGAQVLEKLDQGEFWGLLVRDVVPVSVSPTNRFLQLRLQVP
jgi:cyclophilin family peptidyl-prolyl cis-trans isomerase